MKQLKNTAFTAAVLAVGWILAVMLHVQTAELNHIYTPETVPERPIALVLGAGLKPDGSLSDALSDRVQTGIELYQNGHVDRILLTGDGGGFRRNEIMPMTAAVRAAETPLADILTDPRGFRTYESCKRAAEQGVTEATIVTQRFHLARALYLCRSFGIDAVGVPADRQPYRAILWNWTRDLLASVKAYIDIHAFAPLPPA